MNSFKAVAILNQQTDKEKFLIYKIDQARSHKQLKWPCLQAIQDHSQIVIQMDIDSPGNEIQEEDHYFDGAHCTCYNLFVLFNMMYSHM